jgi:hypothetical protein
MLQKNARNLFFNYCLSCDFFDEMVHDMIKTVGYILGVTVPGYLTMVIDKIFSEYPNIQPKIDNCDTNVKSILKTWKNVWDMRPEPKNDVTNCYPLPRPMSRAELYGIVVYLIFITK